MSSTEPAASANPPGPTNPQGLISYRSDHSPRETLERLLVAIQNRGMTVFAHIDHAAGAAQAGLALRPTDLVIFGNARGGTPLMQAVQTIGLDLPLKALVWQDEGGTTWLGTDDPAWLAARHGAPPSVGPVVTALSDSLMVLAASATAGTNISGKG